VAGSVDPSGTIYVLDHGTNEIVVLRGSKTISRTGGFGWNKDGLDSPSDITAPNGLDIYVADYGNHRVVRFDRNLAPLSQIPSADAAQNSSRIIGYPLSVALSRFGKLFILDGENSRLAKIGENNSIDRTIGGVDAGKGRLIQPVKVRINTQDRIYVQDRNEIKLYDSFGNYLRTIGNNIFRHLRTFALSDSCIVAVDSCSVLTFDEHGMFKDAVLLERIIGSCPEVRDLFVHDTILFLLTKRTMYRTNLFGK